MINQIAGMVIVLGVANGILVMIILNTIQHAERNILNAINKDKNEQSNPPTQE